MKNPRFIRRAAKPPRPSQGFSVTEVAVATFLGSLVLLGAIQVFIGTSRSALRIRAEAKAAEKAGLINQSVAETIHNSYAVVLPGESSWSSSALGASSLYQANNPGVSGWASTLITGLYLMLPPNGTASVNNGTGTTLSLTGTNNIRDRAATTTPVTTGVLIYRGNADQSANPYTGTYLWVWTYNLSVSPATITKRVLTKDLAAVWNAVQFKRSASNANYSITFKLVTGETAGYTLEQTSENFGSGQDQVTLMSGRSVFLQNSPTAVSYTVTYPSGSNLYPAVNSSPTPTPTPTPTPSPSPTPSPKPTPTPIPTPTPKPTPTPTPLPIN